ncbi:hypothetical protein SCP_0501680 [Sparassis crispa]|uniref:Uncharacterized protein n=1 Tax=Sparassis crispa TaxID=139825 RepID=A0A401GLP5_9APHY|nr:hypothetical protein SCP_0501680 [Sparassis crispa]GBE83121.1 hypothetical protein SCP_0501680 [Sparassis crispa]
MELGEATLHFHSIAPCNAVFVTGSVVSMVMSVILVAVIFEVFLPRLASVKRAAWPVVGGCCVVLLACALDVNIELISLIESLWPLEGDEPSAGYVRNGPLAVPNRMSVIDTYSTCYNIELIATTVLQAVIMHTCSQTLFPHMQSRSKFAITLSLLIQLPMTVLYAMLLGNKVDKTDHIILRVFDGMLYTESLFAVCCTVVCAEKIGEELRNTQYLSLAFSKGIFVSTFITNLLMLANFRWFLSSPGILALVAHGVLMKGYMLVLVFITKWLPVGRVDLPPPLNVKCMQDLYV